MTDIRQSPSGPKVEIPEPVNPVRIIASGTILLNGADQTIAGPWTLKDDHEVPTANVFSKDWQDGEEVEWGTEPNTGAITVTVWNAQDSGNDFHILIFNRQSGQRAIRYVVYGISPS